MSIVTVHGPTTFGSKSIVKSGGLFSAVDPANGLKWDFKLDQPTTRSDQDFSWAFPTDGTPTPQTVADPSVVTYATAGSKTATLTITNTSRTVSNKALASNVATLTTTAAHGFKVGQSVVVSGVGAPFDGTYTIASTPSGTTFTYAKTAADVTSAASGGTVTSDPNQTPAAGTQQIVVTAVSGAGPRAMDSEEEPPSNGEVQQQATEPEPEPGSETDVLDEQAAEAGDYTVEADYDPYDHTITQVVGYVEDNPDQLDAVLEDERDGRNRQTLINRLEAMRPA